MEFDYIENRTHDKTAFETSIEQETMFHKNVFSDITTFHMVYPAFPLVMQLDKDWLWLYPVNWKVYFICKIHSHLQGNQDNSTSMWTQYTKIPSCTCLYNTISVLKIE